MIVNRAAVTTTLMETAADRLAQLQRAAVGGSRENYDYKCIQVMNTLAYADDLPRVPIPLSCSETGGSHYALREQFIVTLECHLCTGNSWY